MRFGCKEVRGAMLRMCRDCDVKAADRAERSCVAGLQTGIWTAARAVAFTGAQGLISYRQKQREGEEEGETERSGWMDAC